MTISAISTTTHSPRSASSDFNSSAHRSAETEATTERVNKPQRVVSNHNASRGGSHAPEYSFVGIAG